MLDPCRCSVSEQEFKNHLNDPHVRVATCPRCNTILTKSHRYIVEIEDKRNLVTKVNDKLFAMKSSLTRRKKELQNSVEGTVNCPFTHSIENAVIEASSTFQRSFIDFFVVMHEFFDEASMKAIFKINF